MHPLQYTMKIPPSNVSSVLYETQISQSGCSLPIKSVQVLFPDLRYLCLPSLRKYPSFFKNPAYAPSFVNLSWFTSSSPYHVTYQNKSLYVFSWLNYIFFVNGVLSFVCIHTQYTKSALTKYLLNDWMGSIRHCLYTMGTWSMFQNIWSYSRVVPVTEGVNGRTCM